MPKVTVTLQWDTSELQEDLEAIEQGKLSEPTVSAIGLVIDGNRDYIVVYLPGC